jgi:anti-sigma regulatory factor (Ser/Thr protein kinase)
MGREWVCTTGHGARSVFSVPPFAKVEADGAGVVPDLLHIDIQRDEQAPAVAREAVSNFAGVVGPERLGDLLLLTSELVTNAVKYGGAGNLKLHMDVRGDRLRVEITDQGTGFDAERTAAKRDREDLDLVGGWGLPIVETLARDWGSFEGSTHVWFEFELPDQRS